MVNADDLAVRERVEKLYLLERERHTSASLIRTSGIWERCSSLLRRLPLPRLRFRRLSAARRLGWGRGRIQERPHRVLKGHVNLQRVTLCHCPNR